MAKADWIKVNPTSGSGNATVNVSSVSEHTGRVARTSVLTWKAANVADVQRTVNQAGKPEFVDIDDAISASKEGQTVTLYGLSNSKRLTFSLGIGDLSIHLPNTYIVNGASISNGAEISGDPGAAREYNFSISVVVPSNLTVSAKTKQIIVTDEGGHKDVCTVTSAAGDAYLFISILGDIELDYLGTSVSVEVTSNTNWTVE